MPTSNREAEQAGKGRRRATGKTLTNSPNGRAPNEGATQSGDKPSASAGKAAADGTGSGRGQSAPSGLKQGGNPSGTAVVSVSPDTGSEKEQRGRRKRRRRKKSKTAVIAVEKTGDSQPERGGQNAAAAPGGRSRKRRRKPARAIQGRPLHAPAQHDGASALPSAQPAQPSGPGQAPRKDAGRNRARASSRPQQDDLYAALDLGTNNCRLLIAQPTRPGQFRVVDAFSRIVRLGEGLAASGRLSADAMDRAIEALQVCAAKLANRPARLRRLIATEACRSASNGEEFLRRVRAETGLELEIVDRETEARLAVAGCSSLVGRETDGLVLFDIGGGSSEIAMIDLTENRSNRLASHIKAWTSLPVGVVTLSERHGGSLVTPDVFEAMVREVDSMLESFMPPPLPAFDNAEATGRVHLLGTSGTVTTLAGLHLELPRYDRRKVDGLWMENGDVDRMLDRLLSWDFEARAANPCIGADRADLVLAGCAILQSIRKRWPSERMRVADRGLREGLLNEMMAADGAWHRSSRHYRARNAGHLRKPGEGRS